MTLKSYPLYGFQVEEAKHYDENDKYVKTDFEISRSFKTEEQAITYLDQLNEALTALHQLEEGQIIADETNRKYKHLLFEEQQLAQELTC